MSTGSTEWNLLLPFLNVDDIIYTHVSRWIIKMVEEACQCRATLWTNHHSWEEGDFWWTSNFFTSFLSSRRRWYLWPKIYLSALNDHLVIPHLQVDSWISEVCHLTSGIDSINPHTQYLHMPMNTAVSKYLWLMVNNQIYQSTCLLVCNIHAYTLWCVGQSLLSVPSTTVILN